MTDLNLPSNYELSGGEIDNIVYLVCKYTCDFSMRQADLQVCILLTGKGQGPEHVEKLVKTSCEYVWDHIMGEPEECSPESLYDHMMPMITTWFNNTGLRKNVQ